MRSNQTLDRAPRDDSAIPRLTTPPAKQRRYPSPRVLCAILLVVHALLCTWSALSNSVMYDEFAHLPAGVAYWRYGAFNIMNLNPPLLSLWGAAPVAISDAIAPPRQPFDQMTETQRYWNYGEAFERANASRYQRLFVIARLAMIPLSLLGAWIVYRWASEIHGGRGGVVACSLYALCPTICAHASIVGTDVGTAVAFTAAAWLWWRFCKRPSWSRLILASIAVGVAHLCKFNAVLLWPILAAIALCYRDSWKRASLGLAFALGVAIIIINAGYLFAGSFRSAGSYHPRSAAVSGIFNLIPAALPIPLPEQFVIGFDSLKWEVEQQFPGFIFGQEFQGSKWYYFPVALLLKSPLATTLLALIALASIRPLRLKRDDLPPLLGCVIFLLGMIFMANVNLGVRYVIPALPPIFVLAARVVHLSRRWIITVIVLLALLIIENLSIAPRYLSFFNVAAGGPSRGQRLLNDSNFDWGQGLLDLKRWMDQSNVRRVHLGYFGRVDPAIYGIDYDLLNQPSAEPYVAISSYFLQGLSHRLPTHDGMTNHVRIDFYRELREKKPVAIAGKTIYIYRRRDVGEAMREYASKARLIN
jgi:hypothetical protein